MSEIEELYNKKIISTRSHNLCLVNKLDTLEKIHRFYKKRGSFTSLANCGQRSNLELIGVCEKFQNQNQLNSVEGFQEINFHKILDELPNQQIQLIQVQTQQMIDQLDNRTKNALALYLKHDYDISNLIEKEVLLPHFSFTKIKGLGVKTEGVASQLFAKIRLLLTDAKPSNLKAKRDDVVNVYEKYFPKSVVDSLDFSYDGYFKNCAKLLTNKTLFDKDERLVIKYGLMIYQNQEYLEAKELQKKINCKGRDIALLKQRTINKIKNHFVFLKEFRIYFSAKNKIVDDKVDLLYYPDYIFEKIRDLYHVEFNDVFLSFMIGMIYSDTHKNVGYHKSCLSKIVKRRLKFNSIYHFKTYYQVHAALLKKTNFTALISYIQDHNIDVNQLDKSQKSDLVSLFSNSQLESTKLRMLDCAMLILEKENQC